MALGGGAAGGNILSRIKQRQGIPNGEPEYKTPNQAYAESIGGQMGDYDDIMGRYKNALNRGPNPENAGIIEKYKGVLGKMGTGPNDLKYSRTKEWGDSYGLLKNLTETGGLSEAEQGSLRARGISPIRSMYSNMERNMNRSAALSGGRSANFNATAAKMAREGSQQIADQVTNVNAEIAKMVQEGKLRSAPELSRMASGENEFSNNFKLQNEAQKNSWFQNYGDILGEMGKFTEGEDDNTAALLSGMTSLYGTNPGQVETFGNQVMQQGNLKNQQADSTRRYRNSTLDALMNRGRR